MRRVSARSFCIGLMVCLITGCPVWLHAEQRSLTEIPGAVHIDALEFGEDRISIAQAAGLAEQAGLGVAVMTPHDQAAVEYGLPLLRRLLKQGVSRSSIQTYGVRSYIDEARTADEQYSGLIVVDGAEAIPAYYWERAPLTGVGVVRNFHKHLLVIGLSTPEDYEHIPSMTNGFPHAYRWECLLEFWPAPLLGLGLTLVVRARRLHTGDDPHSLKPGILTALIGGALLINNIPDCAYYNPYHGDPGDGPYQAVIDYANQRDALTFWAHPEVSQRLSQPVPWPGSLAADSVVFDTQPYTRSLLNTRDYTGFAIFEEGMYVAGKPGGTWDQVLTEYCAGLRRHPVWAIGELDLERGGTTGDLTTCQTVFFLDELNRDGVLKALRQGAMYARRAPGHRLRLRTFTVSEASTARYATMGQRITIGSSPYLHIDLLNEEAVPRNLKVLIIREGKLIRTIQTDGHTAITFEDPVLAGSGTTYYRCIVLLDDWPVLASNPIFVTIRPGSGAPSKPESGA